MSFRARLRHRRPGEMTLPERLHADELEIRRKVGEIVKWEYEVLTLKLGPDCRYTPDFYVLLADGVVELHEVKGPYKYADAVVKLHAAAGRFPEFVFRLYQRDRRGLWTMQVIEV